MHHLRRPDLHQHRARHSHCQIPHGDGRREQLCDLICHSLRESAFGCIELFIAELVCGCLSSKHTYTADTTRKGYPMDNISPILIIDDDVAIADLIVEVLTGVDRLPGQTLRP